MCVLLLLSCFSCLWCYSSSSRWRGRQCCFSTVICCKVPFSNGDTSSQSGNSGPPMPPVSIVGGVVPVSLVGGGVTPPCDDVSPPLPSPAIVALSKIPPPISEPLGGCVPPVSLPGGVIPPVSLVGGGGGGVIPVSLVGGGGGVIPPVSLVGGGVTGPVVPFVVTLFMML